MPRPPRLLIPHGIYHVTARGTRRTDIYTDHRDRLRFLALLEDVAQRCGWRCAAHCLMTNHFHLLVETPRPNLSEGMYRLNGRYAQWFNARHDVEGHLFERRFHAVLVESDWHFIELGRYLPLNPVRAGICTDPGDWPWSSYQAAVGLVAAPPFLTLDRLLRHFGADPVGAQRRFREFVDDGRSLQRTEGHRRDMSAGQAPRHEAPRHVVQGHVAAGHGRPGR